MPETLFPVSFEELQKHLNTLGYGLARKDPIDAILHWTLDNGDIKNTIGKHLPRKVTTLLPDFSTKGKADPVYDRNYVLDLLQYILGESSDGISLRALLLGNTDSRE